jgi:hypothetical protein
VINPWHLLHNETKAPEVSLVKYNICDLAEDCLSLIKVLSPQANAAERGAWRPGNHKVDPLPSSHVRLQDVPCPAHLQVGRTLWPMEMHQGRRQLGVHVESISDLKVMPIHFYQAGTEAIQTNARQCQSKFPVDVWHVGHHVGPWRYWKPSRVNRAMPSLPRGPHHDLPEAGEVRVAFLKDASTTQLFSPIMCK